MRLLFPYSDLQQSADCLDPVLRRLSLLEARRLVVRPTAEWRHHVPALKLYANCLMSASFRAKTPVQGFKMYDLVDYTTHERRLPDPKIPPWLREADRTALLNRFPIFYSQFGWDVTPAPATT